MNDEPDNRNAGRNAGKAWSEMDVFDLRNHLAEGASVEETAEFLMRSVEEVEVKARELGLIAE
jgi:hypothetical protein